MSGRDRRRPWWGPRRGDLVAELEAAAADGGAGAELAAWVARFGFAVVASDDGEVHTLIAPGSLYAPRDLARALPRARRPR